MPVYNEEANLEKILKKVLRESLVKEIIVVDDSSKDLSYKIARNFAKKYKQSFSTNKQSFSTNKKIFAYKNRINLGKGACIIKGIKRATSKFTLIQDSDLEYDPKDYLKLINPLLRKNADFVLGNRWGAKKRGYLLAQIGNRLLSKTASFLFSIAIEDAYSGFKAGETSLWKKLDLKSNGFEIEAEIVGKVCLLKKKILEVPISYYPRKYSEGKKIKLKDFFKGVYKLAQIHLRQFIPSSRSFS